MKSKFELQIEERLKQYREVDKMIALIHDEQIRTPLEMDVANLREKGCAILMWLQNLTESDKQALDRLWISIRKQES